MSKQIRGERCYICGTAMNDVCVIKEMTIDRKQRKVHSRCKKRREKALNELVFA